jgi:DNA topoisomerase I
VSIPKDLDPLTITLDNAVALINDKRQQEQKRHLKSFDEDPKMEVLNGRYGPYIQYDGTNYRLPKNMHDRAAELTYEECKNIVESTPVKKK